jgi:hypothetical protein
MVDSESSHRRGAFHSFGCAHRDMDHRAAWMGTACILNSRRCGRTHCRYTGPYYLAMTVPVLALASGVIPVDFYGWLLLAILILGGSMIIWWATERAWGKFS